MTNSSKNTSTNTPMRLQKFLARAGIASRRASEAFIKDGRVSVNGKVVCELGVKVSPGSDEVCFDGNKVVLPEKFYTLMLHKPAGFVTSMVKQKQSKFESVASLIPTDAYPGLYPIGRLDVDTTGLLLFTNDGDLGHELIHPSHHIAKTYRVTLAAQLKDSQIKRLSAGIRLSDGPCQPAEIKPFDPEKHIYDMSIYEGRNHQVKRMFVELGHRVVALQRISIGNLELGSLSEGCWRLVEEKEIMRIFNGE